MGIAVPPPAQLPKTSRPNHSINFPSMSQGFHQGLFSFSDEASHHQQQSSHVAQQSRRDKLRVPGFDSSSGGPHPLIDSEDHDGGGGSGAAGGDEPNIYDSAATGAAANMLSEMFNFPGANMPGGPSATELLANQMSAAGYHRQLGVRPNPMLSSNSDWYMGNRQGVILSGEPSGTTSAAASAMHMFLMNPQQQQQQQHQQQTRSASPPPSQTDPSTLHHHQAFQAFSNTANASSTFGGGGGAVIEGQGLSLSLSTSLHQFDMAKADELRVRENMLFFNNQTQAQPQLHQPAQHTLQLQQQQGMHMGYGTVGPGVASVLRSSKYARAAQELLEEFCSVGRGQMKGARGGRLRDGSANPNAKSSGAGGASSSAAGASSSSSKEPPQLSPADRFEHQRKKAKLVSMLDEVDRRYNHYCDQMQMVVNFFDSVMGFGAATPYTALAQKAMSRHFRCLKDAIAAQLRQTCELLGEKDAGTGSGITKGETPRLRLIDQGLRQQRAFHHMGMMEQEAWRPQRGLPERSVNILRSWLFEHFLHPYPSDADKHLLARQTGLSRNQVSNWFINARVRLWKPMIEEMYQQEFKDDSDPSGGPTDGTHQPSLSPTQSHAAQGGPQSQRPDASSSGATKPDPSPVQPSVATTHAANDDSVLLGGIDPVELLGSDPHVGTADEIYRYGPAVGMGQGARIRYGAGGDVSLTLGLRHAGANAPQDNNRLPVRDFSGC
ncbi:BEL1-like homeodomain protein 4 [Rhynchospora pubera]|uniref:BEL1-like homeodomain protein 4 n=1 Tax=Rhynchospora pubera TaxID=906938 RepID=A0AAV8D7E0_9POAL|nr:BEL1-like homeodomain protein 4 [Rhynchospora pubera]